MRPPLPRLLPAFALGAVALVLVALSPAFGRAVPTGAYRPPVPPDSLRDGCWPLPGGAELDLAYQVRADGLEATPDGVRRVLVLHYDLLDADQVRPRVLAAFAAAGVDGEDVEVGVRPFDVPEDSVVRGEVTIRMRSDVPASTDPRCGPAATKDYDDAGVEVVSP